MGADLFNLLGRYFWLVCLVLSVYQYFVGLRSFRSKEFANAQAGEAAIALRRWLFLLSDLPWVVMGWGILVGGVPSSSVEPFGLLPSLDDGELEA